MKCPHLFFALSATLVLAGCISAKYTYGNQTFASPDKALAKQAAENSEILETVTPAANPVHGKALVALPSRQELRKHYLRSPNATTGFRGEQFDYVCLAMENNQDLLVSAIRKNLLFDEVAVSRVTDPAAVAIAEHDFLIYCDIDGWFIKNRRSAPRKIATGASSAPGQPRTRSFLGRAFVMEADAPPDLARTRAFLESVEGWSRRLSK